MVSKVNLKARIERHSRILKDNLWNIHPFRALYHRFNYNLVLFLVVFLFPIYPLFSSFFYENSQYDFYRWDIDETSILDSYDEQDDSSIEMISNDDEFLSINTIISDWNRDVTWYNEVINYQVLPWDSFSSIAYKFWVSNNSILWANNFDPKRVLKPGENIKIPPVSGLIHQVKPWDTILSLASKYKISEDKILLQNWLQKTDQIYSWQVLIMPWAKKEEPPKPKPKPVIAKNDPKKTSKSSKKSNNSWWYAFTSWWKSEFVDDEGDYDLIKRKAKWSFYWWNCTRYVAQYKNVNWSWNAKEWLSNARAKWHATWSEPSSWAIVVFNWRWYNPWYGHVWIVTRVSWDYIIVKDMNYRRLNEVTVRKVPIDDRAIRWYIYVD